MGGDSRREQIMELLRSSEAPMSGTKLAGMLRVSRQVIVQDIALLRALHQNILSTNKGYFLCDTNTGEEKKERTKTIKVRHGDDEIRDELYTIVDCGGKIWNVAVEHPVYGRIMADLQISSRMEVDEFVEKVERNGTKPLNNLTDGIHFHTIEAGSVKNLLAIEQKLQEKGYLCD